MNCTYPASAKINLLLFLVLVSFASCTSRNEFNRSVYKQVKAKIKSYEIPATIYKNEWGMKSCKLFNPNAVMGYDPYPAVSKKDKGKDTQHEMIVERWCRGKNELGKTIRLKLELVLTLKVFENGTFEVSELTIKSATPLKVRKQLKAWFGDVFVLISIIIVSCGFQPKIFVPGLLIVLPISIPFISYHYFMSGWGVLYGLLIFGVAVLMIAFAISKIPG